MEVPESPDEFLLLLARYMKLAPYLVPPPSRRTYIKTLSHPDLHMDNIFVDPDAKEITHIIDWQSASISEMFLQRGTPPMIPHSGTIGSDGKPDRGSERLDLKSKEQIPDMMSHYERLTKMSNPQRWEALNDEQTSILTKPVSLICGAWDREDVFSFRQALINIVARWENLFPDNCPCPIEFTESELELHGKEMELIEGLGSIMRQLDAENMIPLGGMVRYQNYERAQHVNDLFKKDFISLAEDEQQRNLHSKVWPYQDK